LTTNNLIQTTVNHTVPQAKQHTSLSGSPEMATTIKMDASGLLYEGSDFEKWKDSLRSIFAQHFPDLSWPRHRESPDAPVDLWSDVCDSIWWQVSPYIRTRVPKKDHVIPRELLSALRAAAQPFRFMTCLHRYDSEFTDLNSLRELLRKP
jgi:hypothetical protein